VRRREITGEIAGMGASRVKPAAAPAGSPATGRRSSRSLAAVLEFAAERLLDGDSSLDPLPEVLERLVAGTGGRVALALGPGADRQLGVQCGYPDPAAADAPLLAQIRALCALHGGAASHGGAARRGETFQAPLAGTDAELTLTVACAAPLAGQVLCVLALVGGTRTCSSPDVRSALRALATIVAAKMRIGLDADDLAEQASLTQALVDGSPEAIVAVDSSRRISEFNPAAEKLFGWPRQEAIGREMPGLIVPERYRQRFREAMTAYLKRGDQSDFTGPARLRALRADGTEPVIELTTIPMRVAGQVVFCGFMHDLTALETAHAAVAEGEERFRLLAELAPVGIVRTDVAGRCTFVNQQWSAMTGVPAEQARGMTWQETVNPQDIPRIEWERERADADGAVAVDCRLKSPHGRGVWVHVVVRPIVDSAGQRIGSLAALTDVQDRKRAESEQRKAARLLAEQNARLRELDDAKTQFLATVSHELRTPLTSIVSFAELIKSEVPGLDPEAGEYLTIIQRNAERLIRLVSDLLQLNRLEAGAVLLDLTQVQVPAVAEQAVQAASAGAAEQGIRLTLSVREGPDIVADPTRLQQVFDNLISNAVKFSREHGQVQVRAHCDDDEWQVEIEDSGIGIPPGDLGRLFGSFFRASNARSSARPGTGLGLSTAKAITVLHGGSIDVASEVDRGTTFTVHLPIAS
jgi:PAS domain S-box-containing protein